MKFIDDENTEITAGDIVVFDSPYSHEKIYLFLGFAKENPLYKRSKEKITNLFCLNSGRTKPFFLYPSSESVYCLAEFRKYK